MVKSTLDFKRAKMALSSQWRVTKLDYTKSAVLELQIISSKWTLLVQKNPPTIDKLHIVITWNINSFTWIWFKFFISFGWIKKF